MLKKTGVNSGETNFQDYYYGDYLLRLGRISQQEYDEKMLEAKKIVDNFVSSKKFRKSFKMTTSSKAQEDFDLEHKMVD